MRRSFLRYSAITALTLGAVCASAGVAVAQGRGRGGAPAAPAQNVPTPRTPDGKPDMSGLWGGGGGGGGGLKPDENGNITVLSKQRPCSPTQQCGQAFNFERDSGVGQRTGTNIPFYKPEYWEKVNDLDVNGNMEDPAFGCFPDGVPRMGAPTQIIRVGGTLIFLYPGGNTFRVIPIDGRPHDPNGSLDQTLMGDAIGRWEGDTLVVESIGFTDQSWLGWPGWFHTIDMKVEERFVREGNTLTWTATVIDPEVLMVPWTMNPVRRQLNTDPKAALGQDLPCDERDLEQMRGVTRERG